MNRDSLTPLTDELREVTARHGYEINIQKAMSLGVITPVFIPKVVDGLPEWSFILEELSKRILKTPFEAWIKPLKVLEFDFNHLRLQAENNFTMGWVRDQYSDVILTVLRQYRDLSQDFHLEIEASK